MNLSRFNIISEYFGKLLIYNSLTGALVSFDEENFVIMSKVFKHKMVELIPEAFLAPLIEDGFLVQDNDENGSINCLTKTRIGWNESWHFSIMLNQSCNFQCPYCFQSKKSIFMTEAIADRVKKMIKDKSKNSKEISVDWYGGEPLLSFNFLRELNDHFAKTCLENETKFVVSMTTNGYLLSTDILRYLKKFDTSHFQITLDAPREYHNRTRALRDGSPTFDTILGNIKKAVEFGFHVLVRVNVSKENLDSCFEIYETLDSVGLKNRVEVSLRPIVSSSASPCDDICLDSISFGKKMAEHYYRAAKSGWVVLPFVDNLQSMGYCVANYPTHAIIDPYGGVYKCGESFSGEESMGNIDKDGSINWDEEKFDAFINNDPLNFLECSDCCILPICMGGCHMLRFWKEKIPCNEFKHDLDLFVKVLYLNQINMER